MITIREQKQYGARDRQLLKTQTITQSQAFPLHYESTVEMAVMCTVRVLKTDAGLRKRFSELRLWRDLFRKPEGFFRKSEGFFRRRGRRGRRGRLFRRRGKLPAQMRKVLNFAATMQYLRSYVVAC